MKTPISLLVAVVLANGCTSYYSTVTLHQRSAAADVTRSVVLDAPCEDIHDTQDAVVLTCKQHAERTGPSNLASTALGVIVAALVVGATVSAVGAECASTGGCSTAIPLH
jgi:hypothetical protein